MNCQSLESLAEHFQSKVALVKNSLQLSTAAGDATGSSLLTSITGQLCQLDVLLVLMRGEMEKRRQKLAQYEVLKTSISALNEGLDYTNSNLPDRLPRKPAQTEIKNITPEDSTEENKENHRIKQGTFQPPQKKSARHIPVIEYLTVPEFEAVPKYMRGRISYQQVNTTIDSLNQTVKCKYQLIYQPKSAQTETVKKKIQHYRSQQNKDTKNCHFFVEEDLRRNGSFKMDNVARNILNILRTSGRLKEVRGGSLTRYVLCAQ